MPSASTGETTGLTPVSARTTAKRQMDTLSKNTCRPPTLNHRTSRYRNSPRAAATTDIEETVSVLHPSALSPTSSRLTTADTMAVTKIPDHVDTGVTRRLLSASGASVRAPVVDIIGDQQTSQWLIDTQRMVDFLTTTTYTFHHRATLPPTIIRPIVRVAAESL